MYFIVKREKELFLIYSRYFIIGITHLRNKKLIYIIMNLNSYFASSFWMYIFVYLNIHFIIDLSRSFGSTAKDNTMTIKNICIKQE